MTPGSSGFAKEGESTTQLLSLLVSAVAEQYLRTLTSTLNVEVGTVLKIPVVPLPDQLTEIASECIEISKWDWDNTESSWDYQRNSVLGIPANRDTLESVVRHWQAECTNRIASLASLEQENNRLLVDEYDVDVELDPEVELKHVTLFCNAPYRYDDDKSESELESLLLADTMREFISYAVGCMLGRYSLDKPGLILANQGETADDYRQQIPEPTFTPDEDNVIPLLDGDWFTDDISERFKEFLKVTFGTEHFDENLTFLENALYPDNLTGKKRKTIRDYFLKEFYNHHIKLYKKRPIYWLFSSPKGTFNALIYMHRYRSDTVSVVLNGYLREFQTKLRGKLEQLQHVADIGDASKAEKTKALKTIETLNKQLKELEDYERDILFPLAQEQIEIDLDDGVKVNYNKFGSALKKVTGLTGKV